MAIKEKGEVEEDIWMKVVKIDIKKNTINSRILAQNISTW